MDSAPRSWGAGTVAVAGLPGQTRIRSQDGSKDAGSGALPTSASDGPPIMRRTLSLSLAAAATAAAFFAPPASSQGALRPVDAMIVNPPSRPVPVQVLSAPVPPGEGSRTPYMLRTDVQFSGGGGVCTTGQPFTLPAGKRLVLQYLGAITTLSAPAALAYVAVGLPDGGISIVVPAAPPLPTTQFGLPANLSVAGQVVHAYIDSDICIASTGSASSGVNVQLSGYLVDRP
jgi:hypothetical protein